MEVRDPVCGKRLQETDTVALSVHDGKTYHFCCEECKSAFEEDAEFFAAPRGWLGLD